MPLLLSADALFSMEDFRLTASVENVLLRSDDGKTFLIWVKPDESEYALPVLVQPGDKNLQRNQKLNMKVHVASNGAIVCTDYEIR